MSEPAGIIHPPPDLRGIVDSTAKYVAKNGGAFEERIKREHRDKPKFSFLFAEDPFNAYYQHKVKEIRNSLLGSLSADKQPPGQESSESRPAPRDDVGAGPEDSVEAKVQSHEHSESDDHKPQENDEHQQTQLSGSSVVQRDEFANDRPDLRADDSNSYDGIPKVRSKLNEYIQDMSKKLEEPPQLNFLATSAPNLTHMDCDIIKLTAQYIATHGREFLLELVSREQNNSQFDFLKPQHGQFTYMTNLIMQYALIQNQPLDILEQLEKDATSQKHVLDKIKMRAEWTKMLESERKKREEAQEKEKILYSQIDWHDFVIVETIDYQPHEKGEFPPTTADQVGTRLLLQQRYEEQSAPEEMDIDSDMESGGEEDHQPEDHRAGEIATDGFAVPDALPPRPDQIVIRKDYDPKRAGKAAQSDNYFVSPITNERIPVDKIHEHVRYNLSDPRYLEKKGQMLEEKKNEEIVFASGSQIQNSLKSLAERRTDIFGMNEEETAIGRRIGEEEQVQPKDSRTIWDGHKSSLKRKKLG